MEKPKVSPILEAVEKLLWSFSTTGCGLLRARSVRQKRTACTLAGRSVFFPTYTPPRRSKLHIVCCGINAASALISLLLLSKSRLSTVVIWFTCLSRLRARNSARLFRHAAAENSNRVFRWSYFAQGSRRTFRPSASLPERPRASPAVFYSTGLTSRVAPLTKNAPVSVSMHQPGTKRSVPAAVSV